MTSKAAEILAAALEQCASAHDRGNSDGFEARIETVRREILPINDIPRPIFKLAMRFWKEWALAFRHNWNYYSPITENDWPVMARTIARHVRTGTLPNDKLILDNFVRRRRSILWRDLKSLFDDST